MSRSRVSYIFWKAIADLLYILMLSAATVPLYYVLRKNGVPQYLSCEITALSSFALFLVLYLFFIKRADLSKIEKKDFLIGESLSYLVLGVLAALILFAVSGGARPTDFSYLSFALLPLYGGAYLTGNLFLGAALQSAAFALLLPVVYFVKKRSDPSLAGVKAKAPAPAGPTDEDVCENGGDEPEEHGTDAGEPAEHQDKED